MLIARDFETVSDLADNFSRIPERGGQPLIFMIGCGHMEEGQWLFRCFVTDDLTEPSEQKIIADWLDHIAEVKLRLNLDDYEPKVIHWSRAETGALETNYNAMSPTILMHWAIVLRTATYSPATR